MTKAEAPCPICGVSDFETLTSCDRYAMGIVTARCRGCGLIMTNPLPSDEALEVFYAHSYRQYYRKVERPSVEHIEQYGLSNRAAYTAAFLAGSGRVKAEGSILDVGCAEGSLLRALGGLAPQAALVGVEPNPQFAAFAREYSRAEVLADLAVVEGMGRRVDLITVNHVLEHIRQPQVFLRRLLKLLNPGGCIYIDVPDAARYRSLTDLHLAHLYHFTVTSLANLVRVAGLEPVLLDKHDPPRHPLSVRALVTVSPGANAALERDLEADAASARIVHIGSTAPLYFFRRSMLGRLVIGGPRRAWRTVSGRMRQH